MAESLKSVKARTNYQSYLLRLWQADGQSQIWRASLQNAFDEERRCFANLNDLIGYLQQLTAVHGDGGTDDSDA